MDLGLRDARVLVTGASRGMGRAIAEAYAQQGARLVICSSGLDRIKSVANDLVCRYGVQCEAIECDLSKAGAITGLLDQVSECLGGLDIMISNLSGPPRAKFLDISDEQWTEWFEKTFLSFVRLVRSGVPLFSADKGGHILTIGSSSLVQPIQGFALSNVMRSAVFGLVRTLANELAPVNIRVTNLSPGRIKTDRFTQSLSRRAKLANSSEQQVEREISNSIPLQRLGEPGEIANAVMFLTSRLCTYYTGENFVLDGGMTGRARDD